MPAAVDIAACASDLRIVVGQFVRRLRSEFGFPISQATVLSRLDRQGSMTTSALAAAERVRPQSMAQTISELFADGLVDRRPDPVDRRQVLVELTERGQTKLEEDRRRRDGWLARVIESELSPREQQVLVEAVGILRRIAQG